MPGPTRYPSFLLVGFMLAACLSTWAQAAPRSTVTIQVHKSGLLSALGHDHVVVAPITRGALDDKALQVDVTVATKQLRVTDAEISEKDRSEIQSTMLGPKVLDADKYPEIRFHSSRVEPAGPQRYRVTGELELHGTSRPLSFEVNGGPDHYHGKTRLKQTDYGIQPVSVAGGTVKVKDEVEIEVDVYSADWAQKGRP